MHYTTGLSRQTAELHSLIISCVNIDEHPKGHSKYVLRYRTTCGAELAVEKRARTPLLYFSRAVADGRIDDLEPELLPASKEGRNSNLNTLETFRNKPLARLRVTTLETARKALDACVSR
ncbi:hypothetical protein [Sphingorhabdus sp. 109]|jgi:hypothetical protein|uniref:hypothetical protein n=1 Tax=Sphingorhabdus sp. 109 TaxID=2653173 RepID=UPI0012F415CC|nr:hypothetical protein [Sphingorhabdus sp. 109]VWX57303.1 conserved hypothetical protein [Sphingorhabdus sp. 109]